MNTEIKTILEKHGWDMSILANVYVSELNSAIKEICELQKVSCKDAYLNNNSPLPIVTVILQAKNVAE
jgi:hypothetical protein